jgi:hypothetical protein
MDAVGFSCHCLSKSVTNVMAILLKACHKYISVYTQHELNNALEYRSDIRNVIGMMNI